MVSCFSIVRKLPLTPLLPGPIDQDWMTRSDQGSETRPAGSQKQSVVQGAVLVVWMLWYLEVGGWRWPAMQGVVCTLRDF